MCLLTAELGILTLLVGLLILQGILEVTRGASLIGIVLVDAFVLLIARYIYVVGRRAAHNT